MNKKHSQSKTATGPSKSKFVVLRQICNLIPSFLVSKLAHATGVDASGEVKGSVLSNDTHSPHPLSRVLLESAFREGILKPSATSLRGLPRERTVDSIPALAMSSTARKHARHPHFCFLLFSPAIWSCSLPSSVTKTSEATPDKITSHSNFFFTQLVMVQ